LETSRSQEPSKFRNDRLEVTRAGSGEVPAGLADHVDGLEQLIGRCSD